MEDKCASIVAASLIHGERCAVDTCIIFFELVHSLVNFKKVFMKLSTINLRPMKFLSKFNLNLSSSFSKENEQ